MVTYIHTSNTCTDVAMACEAYSIRYRYTLSYVDAKSIHASRSCCNRKAAERLQESWMVVNGATYDKH